MNISFTSLLDGMLTLAPLALLYRFRSHPKCNSAFVCLCLVTAILHLTFFLEHTPTRQMLEPSTTLPLTLFAFLLFAGASLFFLNQIIDINITRRVSTWIFAGVLLISCLSLPSVPKRTDIYELLGSHYWAIHWYLFSLFSVVIWGLLSCRLRYRKETDQLRRFQLLKILRNTALTCVFSLFVCLALPSISTATLPVYTWEMSNVLFLLQSSRVITQGEYLFLEHLARKAFVEMEKQKLEPSGLFHNFLNYLLEVVQGNQPSSLESRILLPAASVNTQDLEHFYCAFSPSEDRSPAQYVIENSTKIPPRWLEGLHFSLDTLQAENERLLSHIHSRKQAIHGDASTIDLSEEILALPTHKNPQKLLALLEKHTEESLRLYGQAIVALTSAQQSAFHQAISLSRQTIPILLLGEPGVGKKTIARAVHSYASKTPLQQTSCDETTSPEMVSTIVHRIFQASEDDGFLITQIDRLSPESAIRLLPLYLERRNSDKRAPHVYLTSSEDYLTLGENIDYYLYYRLRSAATVLPPLRERPADVIAQFLLFSTQQREIPMADLSLSPSLLEALISAPWRRNSQELQEAAQIFSNEGEDALIRCLLDEATLAAQDGGLSRATLLHFFRRNCYDNKKTAIALGLPIADYERVARKLNIAAPNNFRRGVSV